MAMAISGVETALIGEPAKPAARSGRRVLAFMLLFGLPLAVFGPGLLGHAESNDESFYLPLILDYARRPWPTPVLETNQAPISIGPVFFLAHRFWSAICGGGFFEARALSLACMAIATLVWAALGRRLHYKTGPVFTLAFLALPYHAVVAISALTEPFMLCFLLSAILFWVSALNAAENGLRQKSILYFIACGLLLGIAQNAKPPLITVSLALMAIGGLRLKNRWAVIGPFLAIVVQVPCWLAWGGLFPPGQRMGMMPQFATMSGLFPDTSLHLLCVAGTVLWPALNLQKSRMELCVLTVSGLFLWLLFGPDLNSANPDRFRFVGPMLQASYRGGLVRSLYVVPFLAGWLVFWDSARMIRLNQIPIARQGLLLAGVLSIIGFMRSPLGFDRYASCFMALWYLALWPELRRKPWALGTSLLFMTIFALVLITRVVFVRELFLI